MGPCPLSVSLNTPLRCDRSRIAWPLLFFAGLAVVLFFALELTPSFLCL